ASTPFSQRLPPPNLFDLMVCQGWSIRPVQAFKDGAESFMVFIARSPDGEILRSGLERWVIFYCSGDKTMNFITNEWLQVTGIKGITRRELI
ncbi:MAG: hypothetical protein ACYC9O_16300, partial [Candidatus Latescibacterota bacterium]